jgi:hypothetical protein
MLRSIEALSVTGKLIHLSSFGSKHAQKHQISLGFDA